MNNLGDVDKYRYSVALIELGFGTDALHPEGPVYVPSYHTGHVSSRGVRVPDVCSLIQCPHT